MSADLDAGTRLARTDPVRAAVVVAVGLAVATGSLAGCGAGRVPATVSVVPTAQPTARLVPRSPHRPPVDAAPQRPVRVAGPLDASNLPAAVLVGPGFRAYAEPDDAEQGVVANGSSVSRRDPSDVVDGVVPLGCPGADAIARPTRPAQPCSGPTGHRAAGQRSR